MARKKMVRGLPPLPARLTFKAKEHKRARLLEILRKIAIEKVNLIRNFTCKPPLTDVKTVGNLLSR